MKITALVENKSECELTPQHGLSFYIETNQHKMLFDLGKDHTFLENAKKRDIDIESIDIVIISHGHYDHGGGLHHFLEVNHTAKVYIQRKALDEYFSTASGKKRYIGLDAEFKNHPQFILLDGGCKIDEELELFTVGAKEKCRSTANDALLDAQGRDSFDHEQNLIITEHGRKVMIMGCGHKGVVNILEAAQKYQPEICVGGFHLYSPSSGETVSEKLLEDICKELERYKEIQFYTCHCTGEKAFAYLAERLKNIKYLSCGQFITH